MQELYLRCAGLDVHKKTVTACRVLGPERQQETRTFGTTTRELLALRDWLQAGDCTHVAMESTGVYWQPVYNILEGSAELLLVNAKHVKNLPGRKTDQKDAEWLADLLRHGLLAASFVPPPAPTGPPGPDPGPVVVDPGAGDGGEPAAEGAGRREPEAGECGQ